jgi:hypothetical protein
VGVYGLNKVYIEAKRSKRLRSSRGALPVRTSHRRLVRSYIVGIPSALVTERAGNRAVTTHKR